MPDVPLEEGDECPHNDCIGVVRNPPLEGCTCFIAPPCSACITNSCTFVCDTCMDVFEIEGP